MAISYECPTCGSVMERKTYPFPFYSSVTCLECCDHKVEVLVDDRAFGVIEVSHEEIKAELAKLAAAVEGGD